MGKKYDVGDSVRIANLEISENSGQLMFPKDDTELCFWVHPEGCGQSSDLKLVAHTSRQAPQHGRLRGHIIRHLSWLPSQEHHKPAGQPSSASCQLRMGFVTDFLQSRYGSKVKQSTAVNRNSACGLTDKEEKHKREDPFKNHMVCYFLYVEGMERSDLENI
ncbi:hypothetical protein H920_11457 [Fukomys damarensis]|uniref:Uncharacterized protein n=1 Tax=Fukomys damarensis TaxID=885580 RepID=A0A091DA67_FUKDA|nr:hypothetical protein H920_11457 [Fukomys damarensis]